MHGIFVSMNIFVFSLKNIDRARESRSQRPDHPDVREARRGRDWRRQRGKPRSYEQ